MRHPRRRQVWLGGALALVLSVGALSAAAVAQPAPSATELVSVSATRPSMGGDGASDAPSISRDGRYVAFESAASNLVGRSTTGRQIYVRDTVTGGTQLVSADAAGSPGNGDSVSPSISGDGSRVVYLTAAPSLNPSGVRQAMVWTRETGTSRVVSLGGGEPPSRANAPVWQAVISNDGSTVAFSTAATNLTPDDTHGVIQTYARNLSTAVTRLVSVDSAGSGLSSDATAPSISIDGAIVAFLSKARAASSTIDPAGRIQGYLSDSAHPGLILATVNSTGTAAADADITSLALSSEGGYVAFATTATNLTPLSNSAHRQIYRRDFRLSQNDLVSRNGTGKAGANADCDEPAISSFGADVSYTSAASDILPAAGNGRPQVFVRTSRHTVLASQTSTGAAGNAASGHSALSHFGGNIAFASEATDLLPDTTSSSRQVFDHNLVEAPRVDRIDGADRFAVAAGVSKATFTAPVEVAYVASGAVFADALSGSAAAGAQRAPVLLVSKDAVPVDTAAELSRLRPKRIVVLGGANTVSVAVESALAAYSASVQRISAPDRFDLSAAISASVFAPAGSTARPPIAVIASGAVFPDALSGSAPAGAFGGPVLLVSKDSVPASVAAELARVNPSHVYVLGGTNTISDSVVSDIRRINPATDRLSGADRFELSARVSSQFFPAGTETVYVASGAVFPDALSGAAVAAQSFSPMLLVNSDAVPAAVTAELDRLMPTRIVILGGRNTVSDAVQRELAKHVYFPS